MSTPTGPLTGVRIIEVGGIGPAPFAGMLLADMGADVLRVDRAGDLALMPPQFDVTRRGKATIGVDLKSEAGRDIVLQLAGSADALIEGYRPGVMERLGLGPEPVHARNPALVYGRMTGYGQEGPMSTVAGHDINYIALAGALGASQRAGDKPMFPLNLVGDYGGGAMFLVFGVLAAIIEARTSGRGQVVDAAMVDGAAVLTAMFHGMRAGGMWNETPGTNLLDSGAHFYETYETADGGYVAVGALEPQFYARLLELIDVPADEMPQWEIPRWPEFKQRMAEIFKQRDRAEWAELLEPEEACATAVYGLGEAPGHPHMAARGTFTELGGVVQPAAAPRFDRTPAAAREPITETDAVLDAWGIGEADRTALRESGALD
jgi:alpha-methylacyl-CoA racemase